MASHDRCAAGAGGPQSGCYDVVDHIEHASDLLDLYKVQSSMSSEEGAAAPRHPGRGGGMTAAPDRTAGIGGGLPARTRVATAPVRPSIRADVLPDVLALPRDFIEGTPTHAGARRSRPRCDQPLGGSRWSATPTGLGHRRRHGDP